MSLARSVCFTVWQEVPPPPGAPEGTPTKRFIDERGEWTTREREAFQFEVRLPTLRDRGAIRMAMHRIAGGGDVAKGVRMLLDVESTLEQLRNEARERAGARLWPSGIPEGLTPQEAEDTILSVLASDPLNGVLHEMFELHESWGAISEWEVLVKRAPPSLLDLGDLPPQKEQLAQLVLRAYRDMERIADLGNFKPSQS